LSKCLIASIAYPKEYSKEDNGRYFTMIISGKYHFQIGFTQLHEVRQNDKDKGRDEEGAGSGKIKKSKEIRKELPTLTFSGG